MSKSFPEWWKHGQKVRTASDGILTLNISEDAEYWLTNDAGKEVSVFSADILGPASTPEACRMTTDITELAQREKFEAWARSQKLSLSYGDCGYVFSSTEMAWRAVKALSAELVEALEKAQRANAAQDDHINQQQDRIEQLEKGHQEAAKQINSWRRLAKQNIAEREKDIAELDAVRQRIAELEFIRTSADKVQREFADELGCAGDNESILQAIEDLKQLAESRTLTAATADVLAERKRQVSVEGWTPSHDDTHKNNEMAFAAACYAFHAAAASWDLEDCGTEYDSHPAPKSWPWEPEWWKPKSARADLVRAGALILAEIERIDRADSIKWEAE